MKIFFNGSEDEHLNKAHYEMNRELFERGELRTLEDILSHIYNEIPKARKSFFKTDGTLANGTICLVDDEDISLRNLDDPVDASKDIVLISTLHGG